ncbi:DUF1624 domain-containing protein [Candidatus Peregrinibacteria bacterium]|nr:DUF1624 domain-containing protein [Candidatus Peregrinibacteria bacterium]
MPTTNRYPEIDLLRTLAVFMMLVFHFALDLEFFFGWAGIGVLSGGWWLLGRATAIIFLLLVGVSFMISWDRTVKAHPEKTFWQVYPKYLRRGLFVIGCGMVVTVVTYWNMGQNGYIRFGVLHLIGTSIILLPFFVRFREPNAAIAIVFYILGKWVRTKLLATSLFLPLGFRYPGFASLDYYPLIPWLGMILLGLAIGSFFYVRHTEWRNTLTTFHLPLSTALTWPGRHALWIYLLHQPIFLGLLQVVL